MKLKEYIDYLTEMVEDRPELADSVVVVAEDEEGNSYRELHFEPEVGYYDDYDFYYECETDAIHPECKVNAVCIN